MFELLSNAEPHWRLPSSMASIPRLPSSFGIIGFAERDGLKRPARPHRNLVELPALGMMEQLNKQKSISTSQQFVHRLQNVSIKWTIFMGIVQSRGGLDQGGPKGTGRAVQYSVSEVIIKACQLDKTKSLFQPEAAWGSSMGLPKPRTVQQ
jgi:hypothetical protein